MPGVLGLALLSALYPLWQIWRIQPAEVLQAGATVTKESTTSRLNRWNASFWSRLPAVGGKDNSIYLDGNHKSRHYYDFARRITVS